MTKERPTKPTLELAELAQFPTGPKPKDGPTDSLSQTTTNRFPSDSKGFVAEPTTLAVPSLIEGSGGAPTQTAVKTLLTKKNNPAVAATVSFVAPGDSASTSVEARNFPSSSETKYTMKKGLDEDEIEVPGENELLPGEIEVPGEKELDTNREATYSSNSTRREDELELDVVRDKLAHPSGSRKEVNGKEIESNPNGKEGPFSEANQEKQVQADLDEEPGRDNETRNANSRHHNNTESSILQEAKSLVAYPAARRAKGDLGSPGSGDHIMAEEGVESTILQQAKILVAYPVARKTKDRSTGFVSEDTGAILQHTMGLVGHTVTGKTKASFTGVGSSDVGCGTSAKQVIESDGMSKKSWSHKEAMRPHPQGLRNPTSATSLPSIGQTKLSKLRSHRSYWQAQRPFRGQAKLAKLAKRFPRALRIHESQEMREESNKEISSEPVRWQHHMSQTPEHGTVPAVDQMQLYQDNDEDPELHQEPVGQIQNQQDPSATGADTTSDRGNTGQLADDVTLPEAQLIIRDSRRSLLQEAVEVTQGRTSGDATLPTRRKHIVTCLCAIFLVASTGVVILLVVLLRDDDGHNLTSNTLANGGPPLTPEDHVRSLLPDYTIISLNDTDSPQSKAFDWLLQDPSLEEYPDYRVLQRYALATYYYATSGEAWYQKEHWLSYERHECEWYTYSYKSFVGLRGIVGEQFAQEFGLPQGDFELDHAFGLMDEVLATFDLLKYPCEEESSDSIENGIYKHFWALKNNVQGILPPEMFLLTSLQTFFLVSPTDLAGNISTEIGRLTDLNLMFILDSSIGGTFPSEMGLLSNLVMLLSLLNQQTGTLPGELGLLSKLVVFSTAANQFTGTIPSELGMATELESLSFQNSRLRGSIPTELGRMRAMEFLVLDDFFKGRIPSEIGRMTHLKRVLLGDYLSGPIPTELGMLTGMTQLSLWGNNLTGPIPSELGRMTTMVSLDLSSNTFTGPIPSELGLIVSLKRIWLDINSLTGPIPSELGTLTSLIELGLSRNVLTGLIPREVGLLTSMTYLYLHTNILSGPIPPDLSMMTAIADMGLHKNNLTGSIPSELGWMTHMKRLYLGRNNLLGPIPAEIGLLSSLLSLFLEDNNLSINVPTELGMLQELRHLSIGGNMLSGRIPTELGMLKHLEHLNLSSLPLLTGSIPHELSSYISAENTRHNFGYMNITGSYNLSGTIPEDLCFLRSPNCSYLLYAQYPKQCIFDFECALFLCGCDCVCSA